MAENVMSCPKCGGRMGYRLGEYECSACGLRLAAVAPEPVQPTPPPSSADMNRKGRGQNFRNSGGDVLNRDESSYGGGGWTPACSAPPPPGSGNYNLGGIPPSTMFGEDSGSTGASSLEIEKNIFFGIQLVSAVLGLIFAGAIMSFVTAGSGMYMGGFGTMAVGINIAATAIAIALLAFVLYGDQVWAKWGCGVVTIIMVLVSVLGLISLSNNTWASYLMFAGGVSPGRLLISLIPGYFMYGWLLWILWRDIKEQNGT